MVLHVLPRAFVGDAYVVGNDEGVGDSLFDFVLDFVGVDFACKVCADCDDARLVFALDCDRPQAFYDAREVGYADFPRASLYVNLLQVGDGLSVAALVHQDNRIFFSGLAVGGGRHAVNRVVDFARDGRDVHAKGVGAVAVDFDFDFGDAFLGVHGRLAQVAYAVHHVADFSGVFYGRVKVVASQFDYDVASGHLSSKALAERKARSGKVVEVGAKFSLYVLRLVDLLFAFGKLDLNRSPVGGGVARAGSDAGYDCRVAFDFLFANLFKLGHDGGG